MKRTLVLAALALAAGAALAQPYPSRPIRLVVGFTPGGAADFVARTLGEPLARSLGQPVVIENRPGAGSSIAAEHVAKSAPDGYTLLIASPSSISVNPNISPKAGFQPTRDLVPILRVTSSPLVVVVNPAVGIGSLRDLITHARAHPGKLNFASSGNGSAPHLAAVHFLRVAGVDMVHVPFKGGAPAVQSVLAGDTQLSFATPPSVLPLVQAGRLKALAITSRQASPLVAGVPGMEEAGLPDYEISFWYGFFAPAGTPRDIVNRVAEAARGVLALPEVGKALAREGTEAAGSASPEAFATFLAQDEKFWARLVKESGAKAD
jgi:tripartite-type tricarboxylate transporter receptor subunit TctC